MAHVGELLAAIRREPRSPELRAVYADACLEAGDQWGEWLQLGRTPRAKRTVTQHERERELRRDMTGRVCGEIRNRPVIGWRDGFVDTIRVRCTIDDTADDLVASLEHVGARPELAAVRQLYLDAPHLTEDEHAWIVRELPRLVGGMRLELLALPCEQQTTPDELGAIRGAIPSLLAVRIRWSRDLAPALTGLTGLDLGFPDPGGLDEAIDALPADLDRFVAIVAEGAPSLGLLTPLLDGAFPKLRTLGATTHDSEFERAFAGALAATELWRIDRVVLGPVAGERHLVPARAWFGHIAIEPVELGGDLHTATDVAELNGRMGKRVVALEQMEALADAADPFSRGERLRIAGDLLCELGRTEEAVSLYRDSIAAGPATPDVTLALARALRTLNDPDGALAATARWPTLAEHGAVLVEAARVTGNQLVYYEAISLGTGSYAVSAYAELVGVGSTQAAVAHLQKLANRRDPEAGPLHVELGRHLGGDAMLAGCQRAVELGYAQAAPLLASALVSAGEHADAAAVLVAHGLLDDLAWLQNPGAAAAQLASRRLDSEPCPARRAIMLLLRDVPVAPDDAITPREIWAALRADAPAEEHFCAPRGCPREAAIAAIASATLAQQYRLADQRRAALEAQLGSARVAGRRWALRDALRRLDLASLLPLVDALER